MGVRWASWEGYAAHLLARSWDRSGRRRDRREGGNWGEWKAVGLAWLRLLGSEQAGGLEEVLRDPPTNWEADEVLDLAGIERHMNLPSLERLLADEHA